MVYIFLKKNLYGCKALVLLSAASKSVLESQVLGRSYAPKGVWEKAVDEPQKRPNFSSYALVARL